jgi:LysM repeat protein
METNNKNLKDYFLNLILLIALIFSVLSLYLSVGFSEKADAVEELLASNDQAMDLGQMNEAIKELKKQQLLLEGALITQKQTKAASLKMPQQGHGLDSKIFTKVNTKPISPDTVSKQKIYLIKEGDNFSKIASSFNISLRALMKANNQLDPRLLRIGQEIFIPGQ